MIDNLLNKTNFFSQCTCTPENKSSIKKFKKESSHKQQLQLHQYEINEKVLKVIPKQYLQTSRNQINTIDRNKKISLKKTTSSVEDDTKNFVVECKDKQHKSQKFQSKQSHELQKIQTKDTKYQFDQQTRPIYLHNSANLQNYGIESVHQYSKTYHNKNITVIPQKNVKVNQIPIYKHQQIFIAPKVGPHKAEQLVHIKTIIPQLNIKKETENKQRIFLNNKNSIESSPKLKLINVPKLQPFISTIMQQQDKNKKVIEQIQLPEDIQYNQSKFKFQQPQRNKCVTSLLFNGQEIQKTQNVFN